jgi:2-polyprenyl-6-methoxyphenol hydroxylase-like FAD-dependent oxidoreductase
MRKLGWENSRQADGRRAVLFQNGHCETADVVIGADGVHSSLRSYVTDANAEVSYRWVSGQTKAGNFPATLMPRKDRRLHFGHGGDFPFFFPASTKSGDTEWGAVVPENRPYSIEEIRDGYATYEPSVRAILKGCDTKEFGVFQSAKMKPLESWHSGNLVLLGDAVHPISQVSGQGANMAIDDARRLAMQLNAYRLGRTKSIEEAIRSYELCRIGRVNGIIKDNARRTNSMFVKGRLVIALRNTFLKFLFRVIQVKPGDWIDKKFDQPPASAATMTR